MSSISKKIDSNCEKCPAISVVMTAYNAVAYLAEAIESVLNQSFKDFELVIVNDASTDTSLDIIKSYAERESRIVLVDNLVNLGIAGAANAGLNVARGKYVARLDSDDIALPERLALQYEFMERNKNLVVSGSYAEKIDCSGEHLDIMKAPATDDELRSLLYFKNVFINSSSIFLRDKALLVGGYSQCFTTAEDYDFWSRLLQAGDGANQAMILIKYRWNCNNVSIHKEQNMQDSSFDISFKQLNSALNGELSEVVYRHFWYEWRCGEAMISAGDIKQLEPLWNFAAGLPGASEVLGKKWDELAVKLIRSGRIAAGLRLLRILKNQFGVNSGLESKLIAVARGILRPIKNSRGKTAGSK